MQNPLFKLINCLMVQKNEPELLSFFEPQQLAMSPAGAEKLVHCTCMIMEREEMRHEAREAAEQRGEYGPFQEEGVGFKIGHLTPALAMLWLPLWRKKTA